MNQQQEKRTIKMYVDKEVSRRNLRRATERSLALEQLFHIENHFSAEDFYLFIVNKNLQISMATIYNSLIFFEAIGLVTKNGLIKGRAALYTKTFEKFLE